MQCTSERLLLFLFLLFGQLVEAGLCKGGAIIKTMVNEEAEDTSEAGDSRGRSWKQIVVVLVSTY
jgi:hypothetical protein